MADQRLGEAGTQGAGGAEEIAAQYVEGRGADIAQQRGTHDQANGQRRQDHAGDGFAEIGPAFQGETARG
ncbi:hypothetical protein D3C71_2167450 [compost metagenome]